VNNSMARLIDGMVATLRKEIIPNVEGEYARGQAYGVIYMLNSLKKRASWSNAFLTEQMRALEATSRELAALSPELPGAPLPETLAVVELPDASVLEAARDAADARLCELIDWMTVHGASLAPKARARADAAIDRYLNRQFRHEISTSAKPMFVEMSGGSESA
jgi:hypothetical protein